jgi:methionyl aminopeptidase
VTSLPKLAPQDYPLARAAAQAVVETHHRFRKWVKMGVTLAAIDAFVAQTLEELSCRSCFIGYTAGEHPPFPSHACLSVNECVVHGTAGYLTRPMQAGDVLKLDIGVWFRSPDPTLRKMGEFIGDAAWTYSFGAPSKETRRLMEAGKESLKRGCEQLRPGKVFLDFAKVVQHHVEVECGFHLIRGLGGHGIGRKLHLPPYISNVVPDHPSQWVEGLLPCEPGVLVAVEPMLAAGTWKTQTQPMPRGTRLGRAKTAWPVMTTDGSMSVHYEHDVLITEHGPEVLTKGLEDLRDVIE